MRPFLIILGALLLLALLANYFYFDILRALHPLPSYPQAAPPGAVGRPLPWRTLLKARPTLISNQGALGGFVSGNLDQDADEEAVLIGRGRSLLFNPPTGSSHVSLYGGGFMLGLSAWDYDGDGVDDILPEPVLYSVWQSRGTGQFAATPSTTPVFALGGQQLGDLPEIAAGSRPQFGCFKQAGQPLVLFNTIGSSSQPFKLYGQQGQVEATLSVPKPFMGGCFADGDGDGIDEYYVPTFEDYADGLLCLRADGHSEMLAGWPDKCLPRLALNINNDGSEELICAKGIYDIRAQSFTDFPDLPPDSMGTEMLGMHLQVVLPCDLDENGVPEIAVPSDLTDPGCLSVYGADGRIVQREVWKQNIFGACSVNSGGKRYLLLQFTDKILVYP